MISLLFITLLFHSNCMQYILYETKTNLPFEEGYFYIKASDYSNPNYIYIHLTQTNIMLDSLEYCDSNDVPKDDVNCHFQVIHPYKSKTENNVVYDIYRFRKYTKNRSFVVFHYKGDKSFYSKIEVECSDDESKLEKLEEWIIAIIISACAVFLGIVITITVFVVKCLRNKKVIVGQILPDSNQSSVRVPDYNITDTPFVK